MLPPAFVERLAHLVPPDRLDGVLASFALDKPTGIWLNPLRSPPEVTLAELVAAFPDARFAPLLTNAVVAYDVDTALLARTPAVLEGRAYLINPSSLIPPAVLAPGPDDAVLDLCAAPGGKTLQLAAQMARPTPPPSPSPTPAPAPSPSPAPAPAPSPTPSPSGHLAAVEAVKPRFFKLQGILERYGALANPGVRLFMKDGRDVGGAVPERFDKILLDAPCSSEARFDADDDASSKHWSAHKIAECAFKQRGLLRSALAALKVGGTLVYCTCSFAPEENEAVVNDLLAELDGAVVAVPSPLPILASGDPIPALPGRDGLDLAWRILPDALWDGFFLVRLEKKASIITEASRESRNTSRRPQRPARRRQRH